MTWTESVWEKSLPIYNAILEQAFIKELAAGTLAGDKFSRYIAQDEIYIGNYGRQMFQLADMLTDTAEREMFTAFAQSGIDSEKAMHMLLIEREGIDCKVEASAVTLAYNAHTQAAVDTGVKEIALAAMLPCMWIYNRVGLDILRQAKLEGNPYKEWILEYGNEEFTAGVNLVLEMVDRWAAATTDEIRAKMDAAYIEAARFEYDFWEYGYTGGVVE